MTTYYTEYNKINTNIKKPERLTDKKWIITEKVHGSNFSFIYSNGEYSFARRTGIIKEDENFFNYQAILPENIPKVDEIIKQVSVLYPKYKAIIVYGELFGGLYPEIKTEFKPVQKGVFYSPNLHFYAFDIYVIESEEHKYYIDYEISLDIFSKSKILYAEPLAIFDNLKDALKFPIAFNSTIPKKFGLPELETNIAEGIVIKSTTGNYTIKVKNPEFAEVDFKKLNVMTTDIFNIAEAYITKNRYDNVISKIGEIDNKMKIYDMFVKDILADMILHDDKIFENDVQKRHISKWLFREIKKRF